MRKLLPVSVRKTLKSFYHLSSLYGQRASFLANRSIDARGNSIPWYTYPAIEYLSGLDFSQFNVLEYGSGASSVWWAQRARHVVSVEHDADWYEQSRKGAVPNLDVRLTTSEAEYVRAAAGQTFNVIVIDGIYRRQCAQALPSLMSDECMVILDNSDWYPSTAALVRGSTDLIQVDFHGFGAINSYTWTTSIFLSRNFRVRPAGDRLPIYSRAAMQDVATGDVG